MRSLRHCLMGGWPAETSDFLVNPTGNFVVGGPDGDWRAHRARQDHRRHLRRIMHPHGGGAFSGKDPTKVDRSAAYAARYLGQEHRGVRVRRSLHDPDRLCDRCCRPEMSFLIETHDTGTVDENQVAQSAPGTLPFAPPPASGRGLKLNRPVYRRTAAYGHFGQAGGRGMAAFRGRRTDLVDALKRAMS